MKKILLWMLALCVALLPALSLAENTEEMDTQLEGFITEILDGGFVMEDVDMGEIMLNTSETTVWDGVLTEQELAVGQYVFVDYDGRMTFSLPPQAHADRVGCHVLEGVVMEVTEEGQLLIDDLTFGEVFVQMEGGFEHVYAGMPVTIYYDGVMSLSLPALANARHIIVPQLSGTVSEKTDEGFLLTDEYGQPWQVHISEETILSEILPEAGMEIVMDGEEELAAEDEEAIEETEVIEEDEVIENEEIVDSEEAEEITEEAVLEIVDGDTVTIYYNGASTRSIPPQLTAMEIAIQR